MRKEKCFTLLGIKTAVSCQMSDTSKRLKNNLFKIFFNLKSRIWYLVSVLLLVSSIWYLVSGFNTAHAFVISTNTANVDWIDNQGKPYITSFDTAAIKILALPSLSIAKDVCNLRTGEKSADTVKAVRSDTIEFTISIVNDGDTDARDAIVIDSIPVSTDYIAGSASDTGSNDPVDPAQITFQHIAGGAFDANDTGTVVAIQWRWTKISGVEWYNKRVVKFNVKIRE